MCCSSGSSRDSGFHYQCGSPVWQCWILYLSDQDSFHHTASWALCQGWSPMRGGVVKSLLIYTEAYQICPLFLLSFVVRKPFASTCSQWRRHLGPCSVSMLSMWKLSVKLRITMSLGSTAMMYLQDRKGGEAWGYPGLDRCPSCLSNIQPPQDTGQGERSKYYCSKKNAMLTIELYTMTPIKVHTTKHSFTLCSTHTNMYAGPHEVCNHCGRSSGKNQGCWCRFESRVDQSHLQGPVLNTHPCLIVRRLSSSSSLFVTYNHAGYNEMYVRYMSIVQYKWV